MKMLFDKAQRHQDNEAMVIGELPCPSDTLHLEYTLVSGQSFRWHRDADAWWSCLLPCTASEGERTNVLLRVRQDSEVLHYQGSHPNSLALLQDYFRWEVNLPALSQEFAAADPFLQVAVGRFPGLRVMRQDPVENLFSFLCTAAAPLHRIRRGIAGLCREYGGAGVEAGGVIHFPFPTPDALAGASIEDMQRLGLGYRARYLQAAARQVVNNGGAAWLLGLRNASYPDAKAALMHLSGVGGKIADCVCLFSLNKDEAIPIDTHIRRIAGRDYRAGTDTRSLTPATYAQIGDVLRARFGPMAGWAQQFLFFHELYGKGAWEAYAALWGHKDKPPSTSMEGGD